jgi:hypothetical protein
MGQAKRRGTFNERKQFAIKRDKNLIIEKMGGRDKHLMDVLHTGIKPFLAQLSKEEWQARRRRILESLKSHPESISLEKAKSIRFREDEIGWYIFLCQQTLVDPLCIDISQAQRILPFFAGIGERWVYANKVDGIERKISDTLTRYKTSPDGTIFEILVALSYAVKGWNVEFLKEIPPVKSPDMIVRKNGIELFIECKRLDRRTAYSEKERVEFLRLWDAAVPVLLMNKQWIWLKAVFHAEVSILTTDFLAQILQKTLPICNGETIIHDSSDATISARHIDSQAVINHLEKFMVKEPSPMLNNLLGGDWAPDNSEVSVVYHAKRGQITGCEVAVLGTFIESLDFACGITRKFDSEISINKKARDITKLLSEAVKQVPHGGLSVIHIAAETLEGRDVELRRTEKVLSKIPSFVTDKAILGLRFHRLQSNSRANMLFEFDETVEDFQSDRIRPEGKMLLKDIPTQVIVPDQVETVDGRHWEIYG